MLGGGRGVLAGVLVSSVTGVRGNEDCPLSRRSGQLAGNWRAIACWPVRHKTIFALGLCAI